MAVTIARDLRPDSLREHVVEGDIEATIIGTRAELHGVAPLRFDATVPADRLALEVAADGVWSGLVGLRGGTAIEVLRARGDRALVRVRDVRGLSVTLTMPCGALTVRGAGEPAADRTSAPAPSFPVRSRYVRVGTPRLVTRRHAGGLSSSDVVGRCQPIGDASVCGFWSRSSSIAVHAAPSRASARVTLHPDDRTVLLDEDARGEWLRVVTSDYDGGEHAAIVVRGWVHRSSVVWAQRPHPCTDAGAMGSIGTLGFVAPAYYDVPLDVPVTDSLGARWATTAVEACSVGGRGADGRVHIVLGSNETFVEESLVHVRDVPCPE